MATRNGSPVAFLVHEAGEQFTLVNTPEKAQTGGFAPAFEVVDRPGLKPFAVRDKGTLLNMTFTHTVATASGVDPGVVLKDLQRLAVAGGRVRLVGFDPAVRGWWNVVDLSIQINMLTPIQTVDQADLTWKLQEAIVPPAAIGQSIPPMTAAQLAELYNVLSHRPSAYQSTPAPGVTPQQAYGYGTNPNNGQAANPGFAQNIFTAPPVPAASGQTYTVRAGDTLYSIAQTQLGDPGRWQEISDLNHLNARPARTDSGIATYTSNPITPGMVLQMPANLIAAVTGGSSYTRAV